jgi:hypothetical protein
MMYRFKSPVSPDLIMLGHHGDQFLSLIGIAPAAQGILQVAHLPAAIEALHSAMTREEDALRAAQAAPPPKHSEAYSSTDWPLSDEAVSLRRRMSPIALMMETALHAGKDIIWGI